MRLTKPLILSKIHSSRGMTFTEIMEYACKMKGYDYTEYEKSTRSGGRLVNHVRVNRGVIGPTMAAMKKLNYIHKFGDRWMVTLEGVKFMRANGF